MMPPVRGDLPSGTVTFLFTDVEGSTRLLHSLGAEGYAEALAEHRRVIREACATHGGVEVDTQGDAFCIAFPTAPGALAAADEMTEALAADSSPTSARAKALVGAARVGRFGDATTAALRAEEALAIHETLGDAWGVAYSRFVLGESIGEDDPGSARVIFEESARAFRDLGNEHYALLATHNLAYTCAVLDDDDRARTLHEQNLRRARATDNKRVEAYSLDSLAWYAREEGRVDDALSMLRDALRIFRDLGDLVWTANNLAQLAYYLTVQNRADAALTILSAAEALRKELGVREPSWVDEINEETLTRVRTQHDEAPFNAAWEKGRSLTADEAVALALALDSLE